MICENVPETCTYDTTLTNYVVQNLGCIMQLNYRIKIKTLLTKTGLLSIIKIKLPWIPLIRSRTSDYTISKQNLIQFV